MHEALDATSYATIGSTRDFRLSLLCQLFANTRQGLSTRLRSPEELGAFYKAVVDFFGYMDVVERLIFPIAGTLSVYCLSSHTPSAATLYERVVLTLTSSSSRTRNLLLLHASGLLQVMSTHRTRARAHGNQDRVQQNRQPRRSLVYRCPAQRCQSCKKLGAPGARPQRSNTGHDHLANRARIDEHCS